MPYLKYNDKMVLSGGKFGVSAPIPTPVAIPYVKWAPDVDWTTFDFTNLVITEADATDSQYADANAQDSGSSPFWNYNGQLTIEFNVSSYALLSDFNPWLNVYYGSGSALLQSQEITGVGTYSFDLGNANHDVNIFLANGDLNAIPITSHFSMTASFSAYTIL